MSDDEQLQSLRGLAMQLVGQIPTDMRTALMVLELCEELVRWRANGGTATTTIPERIRN